MTTDEESPARQIMLEGGYFYHGPGRVLDDSPDGRDARPEGSKEGVKIPLT